MPQKPDIHAGLSLYDSDLRRLNALALQLSSAGRRLRYRRLVRFLAHAVSETQMFRSALIFAKRKSTLGVESVAEHGDVVLIKTDVDKILRVERSLLARGVTSSTTEILRATWRNPPAGKVLAKALAVFDIEFPDGRSRAGRALRGQDDRGDGGR